MDSVTRYSAVYVLESTALLESIFGFEACWLAQFWTLLSVQADSASNHQLFLTFLEDRNISFRLVPPQRHSKNPIESKHSVIRSIYIRLKDSAPGEDAKILALRAVTKSNGLYGSNLMSFVELAKGYTKPLDSHGVKAVPNDVLDAHQRIQAKRKLALILRSKSISNVHISPGDIVEVYSKGAFGKLGGWSKPKIVLQVDKAAGFIIVPAKDRKRTTVSFEDIRLALPEDSFAQVVQAAIDAVDETVDEVLASSNEHEQLNDPKLGTLQMNYPTDCQANADFSGCGTSKNSNSEPESNRPLQQGERVMVYWPDNNAYYAGTVNALHSDGHATIHYDDGDIERLNMDNERWLKESQILNSSQGCATSTPSVIDAEPHDLALLLRHFGNKAFLKHEAQGFPQYTMYKAYQCEEKVFTENVRIVPNDKVPIGANIVNSHVIYKLKKLDDDSLKLKARIAPHGNEDDMKSISTTDCSTCPPTGLRIAESIASLFGWKLYKADVKSAFLQTGLATRQVFVKPPRESAMRSSHLWLLLTAAYGLVNANAKWQQQSDQHFIELGLTQSKHVPQLFYYRANDRLTLVVAKVVDDIKAAGEGHCAQNFITAFDNRFALGTVSCGPGKMRFFGINSEQLDDWSVATNAEDKLEALTEYPISRPRRKERDCRLNRIEKTSLDSTNSSIGWVGTAASPFCSFYASYLRQKAPDTKVSHLVEQQHILTKLKKLGTTIQYLRPSDASEYTLTVLTFADASKVDGDGELGVLVGLLVGELKINSIFHTILWISHKSKRPVKSVPAAEILAAAEAIDESKTIAHTYTELLGIHVNIHLCGDSKDLFTSLSTQRNSVDRSIRGDVACIRFEFQIGNIHQISWISGKMNLADVLTKKDSPLTEGLQLTLFTGRLCIAYEDHIESKDTVKNYG